jgi:hypothetical protein
MEKAFDIRALKEKCTHSFYKELKVKESSGKHRENFKMEGKVEWDKDWVNLLNDSY